MRMRVLFSTLTFVVPLMYAKDALIPVKTSQPLFQPASKKTMSSMSFEELKKAKNELVASGNKDRATKYLQKMIVTTTDTNESAALRLELADIYFEQDKMPKAEKIYEEFALLYPGNKYVEYARYRSILCGFYRLLDVERDQTKTKETLERAERFLKQATGKSEYRSEVEKIAKNCQEHLFNSELKIARFYAGQGKTLSANTRIASIEKEFDGKIANLKPRLLLAECDFAQWNGDAATFAKKSDELASQFPDFKQLSSVRTAKRGRTGSVTPRKRDFVAVF